MYSVFSAPVALTPDGAFMLSPPNGCHRIGVWTGTKGDNGPQRADSKGESVWGFKGAASTPSPPGILAGGAFRAITGDGTPVESGVVEVVHI